MDKKVGTVCPILEEKSPPPSTNAMLIRLMLLGAVAGLPTLIDDGGGGRIKNMLGGSDMTSWKFWISVQFNVNLTAA